MTLRWRARAAALALTALWLGACASRGRLIERRARPIDFADLEAAKPEAGIAAPAPLTRTVQVVKGDNLWDLSRHLLGRGALYPVIAQANGIQAPWVLQPGQVLQVPGAAPLGSLPAVTVTPLQRRKDEAAQYGWARQPNHAYTVGEKLTFAVQYGAITAGYATLSIPEAVLVNGRPCFHILAEARTHPFFETFFKVRDRIESYIDVDHGFPWRYEKHLREGGYSADAFYLFDQRLGRITEPDKGHEAPMPIGSQDVISCFYWFRNLPLKVGDEASITVTADDMKTYDLRVNVLRKERVSTLAGDFDTVLVQPHLKFQGVFQQKGEVFLWLTDDARRIPVKIRSKIAIGSININLQNAEWVEPAAH